MVGKYPLSKTTIQVIIQASSILVRVYQRTDRGADVVLRAPWPAMSIAALSTSIAAGGDLMIIPLVRDQTDNWRIWCGFWCVAALFVFFAFLFFFFYACLPFLFSGKWALLLFILFVCFLWNRVLRLRIESIVFCFFVSGGFFVCRAHAHAYVCGCVCLRARIQVFSYFFLILPFTRPRARVLMPPHALTFPPRQTFIYLFASTRTYSFIPLPLFRAGNSFGALFGSRYRLWPALAATGASRF